METNSMICQPLVEKLQALIDEYGNEPFCDSLQAALDTHPLTQASPDREHVIIYMPKGWDLEAVGLAAG
ncbi:MAG: hypothetical protein NVS2B14_00230 [Chamaesiphon sp.]